MLGGKEMWFNNDNNFRTAINRILQIKAQVREVARVLTPGGDPHTVEEATTLSLNKPLGSTGAGILAKWLQAHRFIRHLSLQGAAIADEGLLQLVQVLVNHATLTSVDLRKCDLKDRGLRSLAMHSAAARLHAWPTSS